MESINLIHRRDDTLCPNCGERYRDEYDYCPHCSQKSGLGLHSVWHMIGQFFANTFNIESKITQTAIGLVRPGFLTREYLATRRVNYLSPIRVFIVLMFMFFLLLSFSDLDSFQFKSSVDNEGGAEVIERDLNRDMLLQTLSVDNYIHQQLIKIKQLNNKRKQQAAEKQQAEQIIDQLIELLALDLKTDTNIPVFGNSYRILDRDVYELTPDEIIEKYRVEPLLDQLLLGAMLRFTQDPKGFVKFLFGNMTWAIFLDVLMMAAIFKLFYPKTRYVVHFVYHLHLRSFMFLAIMLAMGLYWLYPIPYFTGIIIAIILGYTAVSLHRVYPRNLFKTIIYFILLIPLAMISFFIATFLIMFLSSMMF